MSIDFSDVMSAAARIRGRVHETPVATSEKLNDIAACQLFFKCENLQKTGAFKARGAVNAVFSLDERRLLRAGVATHSSGNHGAALAWAAQLRGAASCIVVPDNARQVKREAIAEYGGRMILCRPSLAAREEKLAELIADTGAAFVHPHDSDEIIAGQGTAALELGARISGLDCLVVPVGGGGLLAGSALVAAASGMEIYGAEPEGADDACRSLVSGRLVRDQTPDTICDGLLTTLGERNFAIIREKVSGILLAADAGTIDAMRLIWTRLKMVVEPSAAVALAAVLCNRALFAGRRVGVILSGGNVDPAALPF